jgi:hypothetical protein
MKESPSPLKKIDNPVDNCVDNYHIIHNKQPLHLPRLNNNHVLKGFFVTFPPFSFNKKYKLIIFALEQDDCGKPT